MSWCLFIIPVAISSAASASDSTLQSGPLAITSQIGLFILIAELIAVMVYDWRGVISLRGAFKRQTMRKGKLVSTAPGCFLLYLFLPEFMLPIYLIRVVEQPKICPSCATTTFSDAKFCPKCRASLI